MSAPTSPYDPALEYGRAVDSLAEDSFTPPPYTEWLEQQLINYVRWHSEAVDAFDSLRERVTVAVGLPVSADLQTALRELAAMQGDGR